MEEAETAGMGTTAAGAPSDRLAATLQELAGLDAAGLARRWRQSFGSAAPPGLSPALRARILAHRLQAKALGDLDRDTARALDRLATCRLSDDAERPSDDIKPGSRPGWGRPKLERMVAAAAVAVPIPDRRGRTSGVQLTRAWGGRVHTVTVVDDGYAWDGATYPSLSRVAQAITGTKWNGPRFFGLRAIGKPVPAANALPTATVLTTAEASGGRA